MNRYSRIENGTRGLARVEGMRHNVVHLRLIDPCQGRRARARVDRAVRKQLRVGQLIHVECLWSYSDGMVKARCVVNPESAFRRGFLVVGRKYRIRVVELQPGAAVVNLGSGLNLYGRLPFANLGDVVQPDWLHVGSEGEATLVSLNRLDHRDTVMTLRV